jgi:hypothetical protein
MLAARSSAFVSDDLLGKMIEANNSLFCFSDPSTNISIPEFARALWFSESFALNIVYGFFHLFSFFAFLRVKLCFPPLLYSLKSVPHSYENASTSNGPYFHFFLYSLYSFIQSGHFPTYHPSMYSYPQSAHKTCCWLVSTGFFASARAKCLVFLFDLP